jgi:hypothetical protein
LTSLLLAHLHDRVVSELHIHPAVYLAYALQVEPSWIITGHAKHWQTEAFQNYGDA